MARLILAVNCGSSSLKFGFYQCNKNATTLVCEGEAEEVGGANSIFWIGKDGAGEKRKQQLRLDDHAAALAYALEASESVGMPRPDAVGHRFVHGGPGVREHQRLQPEVLDKLREAISFAPLHVPPALAVLEALQQQLPHIPQVVCLDTAFHRTMPDVSKTFALPEEVRQMGIERYGFHGLSLESILEQLAPMPRRLIVAHLGNGASITAIRDSQSIDTTMGLTPTGGVMMGTRCGDLDPGVMLFLLRDGFASAEKLEMLVDRRSGLRGVSGKSSDVRELLNLRKQDQDVDLALRMFCYQARKAIAAMAAALGGLDALVFTGGIGEHAMELRNEICAGLDFIGEFRTLVLPSQEDLRIATITAKLVS